MIRIRRGIVLEVSRRRPGLLDLTVEVDGERAPAIAFEALTAVPERGDVVVLNTTARALGLGTGGFDVVIAVEGRDAGEPGGHAMKLRYTPVQASIEAVEERERDRLDAVEDLAGLPIVTAGLHSALAPIVLGARTRRPDARIVYVMTDGGALPMALSDTVAGLRAAGLLDMTITAGHAFGGELEAVTLPGALAAARAVADADLVVVAMGPGNLGTGSRWGSAALEVASIIDTADAMDARCVVAPRLSFADPRNRHRGLSHHTITALTLARSRAMVSLPALPHDQETLVREQASTAGLDERHDLIVVPTDDLRPALASPPVPLRSMGREYQDDPAYFEAAAGAGALAAER